MSQILIATSIAPKNIENQRKAVDSWIKAGFDVVSLNCKEEYDLIHRYFADIRFEIVGRGARAELGKPYIYFDDFMKFFQGSNYEICGIINSDNHLIDTDCRLGEFICREAKKGFLFGSRLEVKSLEEKNGMIFEHGFDYFFFDKQVSFIYPKNDFCIGQPVWDYWVVYIPIIKGIEVKKVVNPLAYHVSHAINWDMDNINKYIKKLLLKDELTGMEEFGEKVDFSYYCLNMVELINNRSKKVYYSNHASSKEVVIVYERRGAEQDKSETYKSIRNQTYKYIKVIEGEAGKIDIDSIDGELLCFVKEGTILADHYAEIMADSISDYDYAVCGIRILHKKDYSIENVYPVNNETWEIDENKLLEECVMYKKETLKKIALNSESLKKMKMKFIGQGLVKMSMETYLTGYLNKRLNKTKRDKLYIYAAGGHTKKLLDNIDFSKYNLCGFVDKDISLEGTSLAGKPIYHVDKISELDIDYILISSHSYESEIYRELCKFLDPNKIIRIYNR